VQQFEVGRGLKGCKRGRNVEIVIRVENGQVQKDDYAGFVVSVWRTVGGSSLGGEGPVATSINNSGNVCMYRRREKGLDGMRAPRQRRGKGCRVVLSGE
jgi:hypothetical protein